MESQIACRIPSYVKAVTDALQKAGHRGYLVGGSLRDLLLGKTPHDYDLTTDATPDEMLEIFSAFRTIPTGLKHGTLTVMSEGNPIEVTTHRVDGDYLDSRRPESVSFTRRLEEDLSRRDFTVNAMAWNQELGLVDLFGGRDDLQRGVIRAVGNPVARFTEDALRILRAFRFSAQLNFAIDPDTLAAAGLQREGLSKISAERVFSEIKRLLVAPAAARGLAALCESGCEREVFHGLPLRHELFERLEALPPEAALRLALLLCDHTPAKAEALCRAWRTSNVFCDSVTDFLAAFSADLPHTSYEARRHVCSFWKGWEGAMQLRTALGQNVEECRKICHTVAKNGTAVEIKRLAVNGRELQTQLGVAPRDTGTLLLQLQDLVWQDPARNKKAVLLELARAILNKEMSV